LKIFKRKFLKEKRKWRILGGEMDHFLILQQIILIGQQQRHRI
jgi:hypothetical protein